MEKNINTRKKKKGKRRKISVIALYMFAIVVLYVVIFVIPKVTGFLNSTYSAEYGELRTEDTSEGYVIRNEIVYRTASGGTVNKLQKEGQLVRAGTVIAEVAEKNGEDELSEQQKDIVDSLGKYAPKTDNYTTTEGGIVSYYADGMEHKLNSEKAFGLDKSFYGKLNQKDTIKLGKGKLAKGAPVYKIYDENGWYVLTYVKKSHLDRYTPGSSVKVIFDEDADNPIKMKVVKVGKEGNRGKVFLKTDRYYKRAGEMRTCKVTVITADARGLVIERDSLTKKKGQVGVYIKNKQGKPVFKPVMVYAESGDRAVIADSYFINKEGTKISSVNPYDDVYKKFKE